MGRAINFPDKYYAREELNMKQDIADRLEILEGQRAEAKQLRKAGQKSAQEQRSRVTNQIHQFHQLLHLRVLQGRCRGLTGFITEQY